MFGHKEHLIEQKESRIETLVLAENNGVITPDELEDSLREMRLEEEEIIQIILECGE